ncbi:MAG: ABC transporter substrate-binding protein [Alphaproteobacteria bacterium]
MDKIAQIKSLFRAGKIDRREFMQGAAALGIGAAAATQFVKEVKAATPKRGGDVKAASAGGQTADSMDVATWVNQHQMMTGITINEYLTETDGQERLQARFAESWEPADGGAKWVFKLRKGVEHSNGKTVDANDVVASFNYHVKEDSKSSFKPQVEQIASIEADGDDTVIFTLNGANADFPVLTSDYRAAILPTKDGEPLVLDGSISAGSYKLENFEPGVRAIMTRNTNYWKDDVAFFDSVELLTILDDNARQNALVTGDIHVMERGDVKTVDRLGAIDGITVHSTEGKQHYAYPMNTTMAPYDNNDVRMAIKLSLDREEFLQKILRGYGSVGNDQPISKAYNFYDPSIPQRTYDPEKAKWHLKQAGHSSLDITMSISDTAFPGAVDGAVLLSESAKKSGINLTIDRVPQDGYWSNTWMKTPFCGCLWYGRPVADEALTVTYASGGSWNDTFWSNERFDKLLVMARSELDESKRAEMYGEMQRLIRDEGGQLIPGFAHWVDVASDKIQTSERISGRNALDGFRFAERWSFKG